MRLVAGPTWRAFVGGRAVGTPRGTFAWGAAGRSGRTTTAAKTASAFLRPPGCAFVLVLVAFGGGLCPVWTPGDFFLTAAPSELVGEGGLPLCTAQRAKRRKVSSTQELLRLYTNAASSSHHHRAPALWYLPYIALNDTYCAGHCNNYHRKQNIVKWGFHLTIFCFSMVIIGGPCTVPIIKCDASIHAASRG